MAIGVVSTAYGKVEGVEFDGKYAGITTFKGIPYAAPPVGRLRWAPPERPAPWEGVRRCDTHGPAAVQTVLSDNHAVEYYWEGFPPMSEDCLYLNITTGAASAHEKRPVYIWFHGGGLTNCYAYEPQFNPQELARKGVVVVTVGQRLNLFGYLALPQLTARQGKSGNYGFMDQLQALDWICENIGQFGGDPDNITAGGQSGGSLKACMLAATPAAGGRVKRVINQSGLKWMIRFITQEEAERQGIEYLRYAGIYPDSSLEELRSLDTYQIYVDAPRVIMPGDMVCDGELVPGLEVRDIFHRHLGRVDFLNGCNFGETDVFAESEAGLNPVPVRQYLKEINTAADFYAHFRNLLGELYGKHDFERLVQVTDADAWRTARWLATQGLGGREGMNVNRNLMENRLFGRYMAAHRPGAGVYNYLWTHIQPCRPEDYGTNRDPERLLAWHSSELWYTFNSLREGVPPVRPWQEADFRLGDTVSSFIANFVRTGNPNGQGLPHWPNACENGGYLELCREMKAVEGMDGPLDPLLRDFVRAEYKLDL